MGLFLPAIQVGQRVVVKEIHSETSARTFLAGEGILADTEMELLASAEGGAMLVRSAPGKMVNLSAELAARIWVIPLEQQPG
jgi:Fe2+ transport system protein FeoA